MNFFKRMLTVLCLVTILTGAIGVMPAFAEEESFGIESEAFEKAVAKTKVTVKASGSKNVLISWTKVKGAVSYEIYRKEIGGSYKKIATKKTLSFVDKKATAGTPYYYAVRVRTKNARSGYSAAKGFIVLKKLTARDITTDNSYSSTFAMVWPRVTGATHYRIVIKASNGFVLYDKTLTHRNVYMSEYSLCGIGFDTGGYTGGVKITVQPIYRGKFKINGPKSAAKSVSITR